MPGNPPTTSDITPEDLIVAFGHCQLSNGVPTNGVPENGLPSNGLACPSSGSTYDNDHDGYANDISGWNFNRDDNDPQTEQSVYEHFDGESSTLAGEGNNGFSDLGLCPECRYLPIKAGDEAIDRPDRVAEAIVFAVRQGVNVMDVTDASLGLNQTVQSAVNYAYAHNTVVVWASNDFEAADHTDGMYYANVWPGNSLAGDHSTRNGAQCAPNSSGPFCPWVMSDTTFQSRSSLTSFGPHALFSVPNTDGSTSSGTPTNAGVAALIAAEGIAATQRGQIASPLTANEVRQVVRATATPISQPCPVAEPCFTGPSGAGFNIQYGYGRPNLPKAAALIDAGDVPPAANLDSPSWYQQFDPRAGTVHVTADVGAPRDGGYSWRLQYGVGPQPLDSGWTTFAIGSGAAPTTISGDLSLSDVCSKMSCNTSGYAIDSAGRTSIDQFDVSIRVQVRATNPGTGHALMGEDRRAIHVDHDPSLITNGAPLNIGASGDASPTLADLEGDGQLDTILPTSDGSVDALRPDGTEAPGFPVHTGPAVGMNPAYDTNYLGDPVWANNVVPRPRDPIFSTAAVGDLTHTGALDIVAATASGYTYAWDGTGTLLPGFPVLNGSDGTNGTPDYFHSPVPPHDTPYSFDPENYAAASPVLAHLMKGTAACASDPSVCNELDIIQAAGDDRLHAWRPNGQSVPGWPVNVDVSLPVGQTGGQRTHDSKTVTTPAVVDINGDGIPDLVLGLDDTRLGTQTAGAGVEAYLLAFDGRGTGAGNGGLLPGYPSTVQGLVQGYGVAQDFVTQGTESPVVYNDPQNGPQAVVNANLFLPVRVNLANGSSSAPFAPTTISPAPAQSSCPTPNTLPPTNPGQCTLVQFTSSASLGKANANQPAPFAFQTGSAGADVLLGITQTQGIGVRVDSG
ncbi:MAG: S8 family serine peptidase, partial [Candidatus Dormibacteria bacterium]